MTTEHPIAHDVRHPSGALQFQYLERADLTGHCECPVAGCFHRNQPNLYCRPDYCREKQESPPSIEQSPFYKLGQEMAERREKAVIDSIIGGGDET